LTGFADPEDGGRYLVFEARLKRIGLDTGHAPRWVVLWLQGVGDPPP